MTARDRFNVAAGCTDDICGILDTCWEGEIHSVVDAIQAEGMPAMGFTSVLLDDCWAAVDRDANGNIQPDAEQFPAGMPALREYVEGAGMELGLYTCAGPKTCRWNRTGSGGHYAADSKTFASWGVRMVKADNCNHPSEPPEVYYGNFSAALNATGFAIHFNLCEWGEDAPWSGWGGRIAQSYRVGLDHLPLWSFQSLRQEQALWGAQQEGTPVAALPARFAFASAHVLAAEEAKRASRAEWDARLRASGSRGLAAMLQQLADRYASGLGQGTSDIIAHMGDVSNFTTPFGKDDPDFAMTLFNPFLTPFIDSQTEWSFWSLWGGNLLFATDPRNMTAEKRSIVLNTEVTAVHQDPAAPAGTRRDVGPSGAETWARTLTGGDIVAILFNPTEANLTATMQWSAVGVQGQPSAVRDLWNHADLPVTPSFTRELEPHQVAMLRLKL